jgi:hypothetical protein
MVSQTIHEAASLRWWFQTSEGERREEKAATVGAKEGLYSGTIGVI